MAITYDAVAAGIAASPARKSFLRRFLNAFVEARMRQAEREIALHRHLLPADYELSGGKLTERSEDQLPFIR
jgi:hypothetical protein